MNKRNETTDSFRERLTSAAKTLPSVAPTEFHVARRVHLDEHGVTVGVLLTLLRLAFSHGGTARGTLIFEWPDIANAHPITNSLRPWVARCGVNQVSNLGDLALQCRTVTIEESDTPLRGTRLVMTFPLHAIRDEMKDLLGLTVRLGIAEQACARLDDAVSSETDDQRSTGFLDAPRSLSNQVRIDAIRPNQVYDREIHPTIAMNEEVMNSEGATFRLVLKLVGRKRRRAWIKIPARIPDLTSRASTHGDPHLTSLRILPRLDANSCNTDEAS